MAELLGTKYCVESLQRDVRDVQNIVADVISRVGQVEYQSWKFPDKLSLEVNVDTLLDEYKYNDADEERNQVVHIMLYDLLIDRFVFLLQSLTQFNEKLLCVENSISRSNSSKQSSQSMSAGLTAKTCWNKLIQVATVLQQFANQVQRNTMTIAKTKSIEIKPGRCNSDKENSVVSRKILCHSDSQTSETSYSLCEICNRTQICLYEVGNAIVEICKSQGLPTALEDYIEKQRDSNQMSIAELSRWKNLQKKDLSRIDRHLAGLMKQIKPLKQEIASAMNKEEKSKQEIERLSMFAERKLVEFAEEKRKYQCKFKETENILRKQVADLTEANEKMKEEAKEFKLIISEIKSELSHNQRTLITMDNVKSQLEEYVLQGKEYQRKILDLKAETSDLRNKLSNKEDMLDACNKKLEKEINKNKTMHSHEGAIQKKQQTMLKRLDELNEECEMLQEKLAISELEKDKKEERFESKASLVLEQKRNCEFMEERISIIQQEKEMLENTIEDLRATLTTLQSEIKTQTEREKILVTYPDLHEIPNVGGSGNVLVDMQQQVRANEIRIDVLQKENINLMQVLSKVSSKASIDNDSIASLSPESSESFVSRSTSSTRVSPVRSSFSVGPGRRSRTPASRQNLYRGALLKPWT